MSQQNTSSDIFFLAGALAVAAGAVATVAFWVLGDRGTLIGAVFGAAVLLVALVVLCLLLPTLASGPVRGPGNLPVDVEAKRAEANRAGEAPGPRDIATSDAPTAKAAPKAKAVPAAKAAPAKTPAKVAKPAKVPVPRAAEEEVAPVATSAAAPKVKKAQPKVDADTVAEAAAEDRPAKLSAPRGGTADDLKKIKGVGPKMEELLNSMGFYHFDQIAAWTDREVAWVDENLNFKGRVTRDDWVAQAKDFAAQDNVG